MNLITKKGNAKSLFTKKGKDVATTYSFQKDYEQWQTLPKKGTTITNNTKEKTPDKSKRKQKNTRVFFNIIIPFY